LRPMFLIGYDSIWIEKQLLMKFVVFWMIDIKKVWIRHKKYILYNNKNCDVC
jgi:hypothetical protein